MNTHKNSGYRLLGAVLTLAIVGMSAAPVVQADSFSGTNIINNAVQIISDPTNNTGLVTGKMLKIDNYTELGFHISGYNATANASAITVKLVRAGDPGTPVSTSTNRSMETAADTRLTITATSPAAVGPWYFYTNLDLAAVGSANWIGTALITNATASASLTNAEWGIDKKIRPIRYP